jgi:hypothetical protein
MLYQNVFAECEHVIDDKTKKFVEGEVDSWLPMPKMEAK